jgi:hypothetical protein
MSWAKIQMICVGQYDLHTKIVKLLWGERLDRGLGAYRDEGRRVN